MASSKDFEKIWESYQEVVKTKDVSIVDYCQRRSAFGRFPSKERHRLFPVPTMVHLEFLNKERLLCKV